MQTALHRLLRRIVNYLGGGRGDAQVEVIESLEANTEIRDHDVAAEILIVLVPRN